MSKALPPSLILLCLTVCLTFAACRAPKDTAYFQTLRKDTVLQHTVTRDYDLRIQPDDVLLISIASASPELSALFNSAAGAAGGGSNGYTVDQNGTIPFFKLGTVKAAGLTRSQLAAQLKSALDPYLKDPVVTVQFANHRFTVLGEVGSPGIHPITGDQVNLLEAIGMSGDLKESAKKGSVLVIRQTDSGKVFHHLNLLDHSIFSSPYFYLQNEDVVYVEPEPQKEGVKTQQVLSYVLTGFSIVTFILSRTK